MKIIGKDSVDRKIILEASEKEIRKLINMAYPEDINNVLENHKRTSIDIDKLELIYNELKYRGKSIGAMREILGIKSDEDNKNENLYS